VRCLSQIVDVVEFGFAPRGQPFKSASQIGLPPIVDQLRRDPAVSDSIRRDGNGLAVTTARFTETPGAERGSIAKPNCLAASAPTAMTAAPLGPTFAAK
jgi:hypothetical protein